MADVSGITAVRVTSDTVTSKVTYGATIAAGNTVYLDTTDNEYKLGDANDTATTATVTGIAITPGVDNGYGLIATGGSIYLVGATLAVGQAYVASANAGNIAPESDITSGQYLTHLGYATDANTLQLAIKATGATHA